ncbi:DUF397 domain-containing protein [Kitasatospora sp. NPDC056327]|uniref:DUF397 domain-containing protein n=1 Tax=Kitasatospora sp. NPDC056327 TaxID=3345785 RepID=UPI0035D8A501
MNSDPEWFKSSYSTSDGGECVEVAASASSVLVRDSKDKAGPRLSFSPSAWADFVAFASEAQASEGE